MSNNQFTGVNVLSLFDGMSCGQIALERSGIKVNKYYASEIDKHAVKVSSIKYPNTIHLGDVTKVDGLAPALCAQLTTGSVAIAENYRIRRLTPIECCRLQTVADDYFYDENGQPIVSETQMYKMLGNGWTVEMIVHFFKHIYHGN
jgi:site-specific DNA-cytosine methylase